ncbi:hypothetical protein [Burkholderia contaminans]|uniref:hypothetical protein n=1 Tax=Burkholderia contaminans TaxID=488447 RepID=UPI0014539BEA|nr:hypothetical protein [Burkholderia contaminans]VWD15470.1 hypothetical protein BCO18442_03506 [Burkholderia contaminans]
MSRFIKVVVGDEHGEAEAIVMRRDSATALDVLWLIQGVAELFDMEKLAQAEGRTLSYSEHAAFGAVSADQAASLRQFASHIRSPEGKNDVSDVDAT